MNFPRVPENNAFIKGNNVRSEKDYIDHGYYNPVALPKDIPPTKSFVYPSKTISRWLKSGTTTKRLLRGSGGFSDHPKFWINV
jgi:hypothetical protein